MSSAELMWRRINVRLNFSDELGAMLEEVTVDCRNDATASDELRNFKTNCSYFEYTRFAQQVLQHFFLLLLIYFIIL
jgi:hypothetical protein